jgi:hypothetical protein
MSKIRVRRSHRPAVPASAPQRTPRPAPPRRPASLPHRRPGLPTRNARKSTDPERNQPRSVSALPRVPRDGELPRRPDRAQERGDYSRTGGPGRAPPVTLRVPLSPRGRGVRGEGVSLFVATTSCIEDRLRLIRPTTAKSRPRAVGRHEPPHPRPLSHEGRGEKIHLCR